MYAKHVGLVWAVTAFRAGRSSEPAAHRWPYAEFGESAAAGKFGSFFSVHESL